MTLQEFFAQHPKVAIAFSGGVDSSYLLYAAKQYAKEVCAYYANAEFQPAFELEDAVCLAKELDVRLEILELNILEVPHVSDNPSNRCYYCKRAIFTAITNAALKDGFSVLLDGTNVSDDTASRPGTKALQELSVLSPLRDCRLTKEAIRKLSREANLFTWDKPAYACLATRIATDEQITLEKLAATEASETFLHSLGFTDFRVRTQDGNAKIQLTEKDFPLLLQHRRLILEKLSSYYKSVVLDLEVRG